MTTHIKAIKAVGDWELDVLGVPYGGPDNGLDAHQQRFSDETDLHLDRYPKPAVHYYHGYEPDGTPQGSPEEIGEVASIEKRADGVWYRVVLDKSKALAARVMDAARQGLARASSGTAGHLVRVARDGLILNWPVIELSLFDMDEKRDRIPANNYAVAIPVMKALFHRYGIDYTQSPPGEQMSETDAKGQKHSAPVVQEKNQAPPIVDLSNTKELVMDEQDIKNVVAESVKAALDAQSAAQEAQVAAKAAEQKRIDEALTAAKTEWDKEAAKSNRLPYKEGVPHLAKFGELSKYDGLDVADQATLIGILNSTDGATGQRHTRASEAAMKALAVKLAEDKSQVGVVGQRAMKAAGIKTDEVMQQDLTGYGDEWVGVAYSTSLWEAIRLGTFVADKLPSIEVPAGHESIVLPLEGADPTYYKVAETEDHDTTMLFPVASVTSSKMATGQKTLSLAKMGARVPWSGELEEDSLIPFVSQLRMQLQKAGSEQMEYAIIDGDITTTGSTNINDIGNVSAQTATNLHLMFNGFRKSPLVTTTANSRDGGALTISDFIETVKLMGTAGINAIDVTKVGFILDVNTHWKALELAEVLTRDVFSQPTIEGGKLTGIFGYPVYVSANMHYKSAARKANSAGKIDQTTTTNNTTGAILAVRWDQWLLGWRRRMTMETTRYPRSDSWEITALMRLGLVQRDTEASAISYNITV